MICNFISDVITGNESGDSNQPSRQTVSPGITKNSDTQKIAVIILKLEQCGSTIE